MTRVLILDAKQRSALAVTRSLGRRGVEVICADSMARTLAGASRYCRGQFIYPSPTRDRDGFVETLVRQTQAQNVEALIPVAEATSALILENLQHFQHLRVPYRNPKAFWQLRDKGWLMGLAERLGVRAPRTRIVIDPAQAVSLAEEVGYPLVIKPAATPIAPVRNAISASVFYAANRAELASIIDENAHLGEFPFLLQEQIAGTGAGIFTLYHAGKPVVFFAHRRIREKPPSGGVSVLSESCALDPKLVEVSKQILDHVGWDGVAMVEFKVTHDGVPYLMEVNARYWGSLQLAIDAGVDFPFLQLQSMMGETPIHDGNYRIGIRNRWLLGDLDHLYIRFRDRATVIPGQPSVAKAFLEFLHFFDRNTYYEVNRWDDMKPFLVELSAYFRGGVGSLERLISRAFPRKARLESAEVHDPGR